MRYTLLWLHLMLWSVLTVIARPLADNAQHDNPIDISAAIKEAGDDIVELDDGTIILLPLREDDITMDELEQALNVLPTLPAEVAATPTAVSTARVASITSIVSAAVSSASFAARPTPTAATLPDNISPSTAATVAAVQPSPSPLVATPATVTVVQPDPPPSAATPATEAKQVLDQLSQPTHPLAQIPLSARKRLAELLDRFERSIQPAFTELPRRMVDTASQLMHTVLERVLHDSTRVAATVRDELQYLIQPLLEPSNKSARTQRKQSLLPGQLDRAGEEAPLHMAVRMATVDVLQNVPATPLLAVAVKPTDGELNRTASTVHEQDRQGVPSEEWLPKLTRKLARLLRRAAYARLIMVDKQIDAQLSDQLMRQILAATAADNPFSATTATAVQRFIQAPIRTLLPSALHKLTHQIMDQVDEAIMKMTGQRKPSTTATRVAASPTSSLTLRRH